MWVMATDMSCCHRDDSLSITIRNITASLPKRQSAEGWPSSHRHSGCISPASFISLHIGFLLCWVAFCLFLLRLFCLMCSSFTISIFPFAPRDMQCVTWGDASWFISLPLISQQYTKGSYCKIIQVYLKHAVCILKHCTSSVYIFNLDHFHTKICADMLMLDNLPISAWLLYHCH